jgi:hypothetical protein
MTSKGANLIGEMMKKMTVKDWIGAYEKGLKQGKS